jgi:hypothetical protein
MVALLKNVEKLPRLTPADVQNRSRRKKTPGNKEAFLRAAHGTMSARDAARMRRLIDETCERIDE